MKKIKKNQFLLGFIIVTLFLALLRLVFPSLAGTVYSDQMQGTDRQGDSVSTSDTGRTVADGSEDVADDVVEDSPTGVSDATVADSDGMSDPRENTTGGWYGTPSKFFNPDGTLAKHAVVGVWGFRECFPDENDVQLIAAQKNGVSPVADRRDADKRMKELVYIAANPMYDVKELHNSIPYLVPKAQVLLQDIGRNFLDSLQLKGMPINKLLVTSVLRTKEDIARLRKHNANAKENSCHLYGTTFDISYNRYVPITGKAGQDSLKLVLCEVLADLRAQNRCYVKYERHQGCFHITVR